MLKVIANICHPAIESGDRAIPQDCLAIRARNGSEIEV